MCHGSFTPVVLIKIALSPNRAKLADIRIEPSALTQRRLHAILRVQSCLYVNLRSWRDLIGGHGNFVNPSAGAMPTGPNTL